MFAPSDPPEPTTDPAQLAEIARMRQEGIEQNRQVLAERGDAPGGFYPALSLFPQPWATGAELMALAAALVAWRERHPLATITFGCLDHLQRGQYPPSEYYLGCVNERTMTAPQYELCPVYIALDGPLGDGLDLMGCLYRELPEGCFSEIACNYPDG